MSLSASEIGVGLPALPRLTTTVPKEYVHRASLAEVFLTGCTAQDDGVRFSLTGQWPRAHTFFNSTDGASHDPLQAAETFRQAGMFVTHAEHGVPLGHHFVLWSLSCHTDLEQLRIASRPTDFELEVTCPDSAPRGRSSARRMGIGFALRRDGLPVARGDGLYSIVSPAVYARLRANRSEVDGTSARTVAASEPMEPAAVGRTSPADVVLTPTSTPDRWLLTPDLGHPILFDHGGDHLPGMVLLEGARQAACARLAPRTLIPAITATEFNRYVELDSPCWVDVTDVTPGDDGTATVKVVGRQDGETVFSSTVSGPVV
ncbi:ScbA/BarX family gamma-butyrolactone biosynthesis protein [Streptomyces humi]|uniref:ScbA/BarX family gamma-butyrolactone biosynthesis protein n=1 Tax=Streptomyces humi TaxID=1428620 RepID=UPI0006287173|nr:ScbA/BarX family gamma-butyrolactone biosynthesis protein [Streptomyces humi]